MKRKLLVLLAALTLTMSSSIVAFATDYNTWSSNGNYPSDILNTSLQTPVKYLIDNKIVTGDEDGLFHPDKSITRAEFATMMAKATNNTAEIDTLAKQNYFNDLDGYSWATGYINACAKASLINGVGDSKFAPSEEVTYAEVITVIIRSKNTSAVTTGTWPDNYIQYAQMYMNSMIYDRNITDWNAPATKGNVAMMLYRSMPKD